MADRLVKIKVGESGMTNLEIQLTAKVERLEAIVDGKEPHPTNPDWIWASKLELDYSGHMRRIERRKAKLAGMEEAAKVADENKDPETACLIRTAAKEQTDG